MADSLVKKASLSRAQSIAFVGLTIALIAVGAWITVPIGPIPFTLGVFVIAFAFLVLPGWLPVAAIAGYLLLGAIGVPVFSGMRGGIGVLMGPTGGFLLGYLAAAFACVGIVRIMRGSDRTAVSTGREIAIGIVVGVVYLAIIYVCGWAQYMFVANVSAMQSFAVTVAPFVVVDLIKIVAAIFVAIVVRRAVGTLNG